MRGISRRLFKRYGKRAWLFVGLGVIAVVLLGGGAYAALGGTSRTQTIGDIELQRGLVGWWKLNGNAKDSTPYANNGTVNGPILATDRNGVTNNSYSFSANTDNIAIPGSSVLNTPVFTYAAWVKPTNFTAARTIIGSSSNNGPQFRIDASNGRLELGVQNVVAIAITSTGVTANAWSHVAVSYDAAGNFAFYINGVQQSVLGAPPNLQTFTFSNFLIGKKASTVDTFLGSMNDVRIYNRVLSSAEMAALAAGNNSQVSAGSGENGLVGQWKMDGNLNDSTPYGRNGEMFFSHAPAFVADRKGIANKAQSFNGVNDTYDIGGDATTLFPNANFSISVWASNASATNSLDMYGSDGVSEFRGPSARLASRAGGPAGAVRFYVTSPGGTQYFWDVSGLFSGTNQWQLITWVKNGTTVSFYRNNQLVLSANDAPAGAVFSPALYQVAYSGNYFSGKLDDFRIYNRAITATEIANLYNSYDSQINLNSSPTNAISTGDINSGLVGYWPLNGNAKDATPYSNDGTLVNAPTLVTDRKGRANSAYSFNGTTQRVNFSGTNLPTSVISVSAWVYQSTNADWYDLVTNNWGAQTGVSSWNLYTNAAGNVIFGLWENGPGQTNSFCGNGTMTTGVWHHLAGTYDGTTIRAYFDGSSCPSASRSGAALMHTGTFNIGDWGGTSTHYIDDVRIYNRAISAAEVQSLFTSRN
jgi:hypothetical protein